ncbi:MAG: DUF2953 domain-containing protein [Eubacterium sp.]
MKVFLIILAVLVVIIAFILSLSAELTVIYDNGWTTRIKVLFIEKDIELSKILSFLLFPEKAAADVAKEKSENEGKGKKKKKAAPETESEINLTEEPVESETERNEGSAPAKNAESKPNFIKKILDEDGIVGILLLISNLLQTAGSAVTTLFKGLHIYSLYVKMIIGGGDAADIGQMYGTICGIYYPVKGVILNGMKVDQYDDYIMPDFIAPRSEYEFQFIGSINIKLLLKVALKAGKVFIVNLIKNK